MSMVRNVRFMAYEQLQKAFQAKDAFTAEDLDILRKNCGDIPYLSSRGDWVTFRMDVELIDAIRKLDETSTNLVSTTNRLTAVMLAVTIVGVIATIVGVAIALYH